MEGPKFHLELKHGEIEQNGKRLARIGHMLIEAKPPIGSDIYEVEIDEYITDPIEWQFRDTTSPVEVTYVMDRNFHDPTGQLPDQVRPPVTLYYVGVIREEQPIRLEAKMMTEAEAKPLGDMW
jgi:hypothetical protein